MHTRFYTLLTALMLLLVFTGSVLAAKMEQEPKKKKIIVIKDEFKFIPLHYGYPLLFSVGLSFIFDSELKKGSAIGCEIAINGDKCKLGFADFSTNDYGITMAFTRLRIKEQVGSFNKGKTYYGLEAKIKTYRWGIYYPPKDHVGTYYLINFDYGVGF